jgi:hypothetical protein
VGKREEASEREVMTNGSAVILYDQLVFSGYHLVKSSGIYWSRTASWSMWSFHVCTAKS